MYTHTHTKNRTKCSFMVLLHANLRQTHNTVESPTLVTSTLIYSRFQMNHSHLLLSGFCTITCIITRAISAASPRLQTTHSHTISGDNGSQFCSLIKCTTPYFLHKGSHFQVSHLFFLLFYLFISLV